MSELFATSRRNFITGSATAAFGLALSSAAVKQAEAKQRDIALSQPPHFEGFGSGSIDESYWSKVRAQFTLSPDLIFLNNGTLGPVPNPVLQTRSYYNHLLASDPTNSFRAKELDEVRKQIAQFINAQPGEVSITRSTTEGLNILSHAIDWKQGDEVILGDQENHAAVEPYQTLSERYGIKIVTVPLPVPAQSVDEIVSAYAKAFTPRTRVLVVSHVSYATGLIAPLKELATLAHQHGALICVDGAQSLGVLPIDVAATDIDHYAAAGQKWLLAGTGTGVNFIRKDLQGKLWPLFGYDDPRSARQAVRYEHSGQIDIASAIGIGTAIQFQNAVGRKNIEDRARTINKHFQEGSKSIPGVKLLSSSNPALAANISVFTVPNLPAVQTARLLEEQNHISVKGFVHRDITALRVSTHFYNTFNQIDQLLSVVAKWSKDPPAFADRPSRPA
jgi:selenocysteine lyase/cysteine desulfurase